MKLQAFLLISLWAAPSEQVTATRGDIDEILTAIAAVKLTSDSDLAQDIINYNRLEDIKTLLSDKIEKPLAAVNLIITGNKTDIYQKKSIKKANIGLTINFFQLTVLFMYVLAISIYAVVKRVKRGNAEQMELQFEMIQKRLEDRLNERESKPRRQKSDKAPSTSMA